MFAFIYPWHLPPLQKSGAASQHLSPSALSPSSQQRHRSTARDTFTWTVSRHRCLQQGSFPVEWSLAVLGMTERLWLAGTHQPERSLAMRRMAAPGLCTRPSTAEYRASKQLPPRGLRSCSDAANGMTKNDQVMQETREVLADIGLRPIGTAQGCSLQTCTPRLPELFIDLHKPFPGDSAFSPKINPVKPLGRKSCGQYSRVD